MSPLPRFDERDPTFSWLVQQIRGARLGLSRPDEERLRGLEARLRRDFGAEVDSGDKIQRLRVP